MIITPADLRDVLILEPPVHRDARGFFVESFSDRRVRELTQLDVSFVQDNHSRSRPGVLRGLHYQTTQPQGKLIRVVRGSVFDVAVDLRASSPTFRHWTGIELSENNGRQLYIPPGFAHGFLVTSDGDADVLYKATDYYAPDGQCSIRWDDPSLAIRWPLTGAPILSAADQAAGFLEDCPVFA